MANVNSRSTRIIKKNTLVDTLFIKAETKAHVRKVSAILKKPEGSRTEEEWQLLQQSDDVVKLISKRSKIKEQTKQRHLEVEDSPELLREKCKQLASVIQNAKSLIVYTGAGISTAASIPDYRGPNGVWTLLKQGKQLGSVDLSDAEPTLTHMAIVELYKRGYVKRVVSQNCDGLHIRSGLPRSALSELHGNMYLEACRTCQPQTEFIRLFDVTERTAIRRHKTGRRCPKCGGALCDTIVHFGEKGGFEAPYNWHQAVEAAESADVILCLGSSLKVLKKYSCLWGMHKPTAKRPHLYIVNLQWTPKDPVAALKINGRCDEVMAEVTRLLNIEVSHYSRNHDPIFDLASQLTKRELKTTTRKILSLSNDKTPQIGNLGKNRSVSRQSVSLKQHPVRVMPPRQAKESRLSVAAVRNAKKTRNFGKSVTEPRSLKNSMHSGSCKSSSPLRLGDLEGSDELPLRERGLKRSNSCDGAEHDGETLEPCRKVFCNCACAVPRVTCASDECKCTGDNVFRYPGDNTSRCTGYTVARHTDDNNTSSCPVNRNNSLFDVRAIPQLVMEGKRNDAEPPTLENSSCWWETVDSKTWLEALQAFLLTVSKQKISDLNGFINTCNGNVVTGNDNGATCNDDGVTCSGNTVICNGNRVTCKVSGENCNSAKFLGDTNDRGKASSGSSLSNESVMNTSCKALSKCLKCDVPLRATQEISENDRLLKESQNEVRGPEELRIECKKEMVEETDSNSERQPRMLCTLSDLKCLHDVLFDSHINQHKTLETVCKTEHQVLDRVSQTELQALERIREEHVIEKPVSHQMSDLQSHLLSDQKHKFSFGESWASEQQSSRSDNVLASTDLVRFMHSYCQRERNAKEKLEIPTCSSEASGCDLSDCKFSSSLREFQDRLKSHVLLKEQEICNQQVKSRASAGTSTAATCLPTSSQDLVIRWCCSNDLVAQPNANCRCHEVPAGAACICRLEIAPSSSVRESNQESGSTVSKNDVKRLRGKPNLGEPSKSVPGWFGKGISARKLKRKRLK